MEERRAANGPSIGHTNPSKEYKGVCVALAVILLL